MIRVRYRVPGTEPRNMGVAVLPQEAKNVLMRGRNYLGYFGGNDGRIPLAGGHIRRMYVRRSLNIVRSD